MYLKALDDAQVQQAYVEVRAPDKTLTSSGSSSVQLVANYSRGALTEPRTNKMEGHATEWSAVQDGFITPGKYEVYYYVSDATTGNLSPVHRSLVYKDKGSNTPPSSFSLNLPADGAETRTVLVFD